MRQYVSVAELTARGYGCRSTILDHIHSGEFRAISTGGKWRVDIESYEKWLETRQRHRRRKYERRRRT